MTLNWIETLWRQLNMETSRTIGRKGISRSVASSRSFVANAFAITMMVIWTVSFGTSAQAQQVTADLLGTVTDSTEAVIPNATVTITNVDTHEVRKSVSTAQGEYTFNLLQVGNYKLRVEASGFKSLDLPQLTLTVGERRRQNAVMSIGAQTETISVTTEPPALQTDSTTLGDTLEPEAVQDLPTEGRNYYSLVDLAAGANFGTANGAGSGNRPNDRRPAAEVSVNGQNDQRNDNLLDGMDNNSGTWNVPVVRPSIDAIEEISVATSSYPASFTNTAGAAVNVLTKSGTNKLHGTVYEYARNDVFDSRDFFASPANGVSRKPEWRQNQFGGSVGGPIKHDKSFFFADAEDLRKVVGQTATATVPTLYEYNHIGDFTDISGSNISGYPLDPAGVALYKLYPRPTNNSTTVNNFTASPNSTQFDFTTDGRVDQHFTATDAAFARFSYNNVTTLTPALFPGVKEPGVSETIQPGGNIYGFQGTANQKSYNGMLNYTHIFTPNLILEAKTGYTRFENNYVTLNQGKNVSSDLGISNINVSARTTGLIGILPLDGYASIGDSTYEPNNIIDNTIQEMGIVSYAHGKHSLKIGASLIRRQANGFLAGSFPLGYFYAGDGGAFGLPNLSVADLLLGVMLEGQRQLNLESTQTRTWESGQFIQDDWRITRHITLNLGLRYDVFTPARDAKNAMANLEIDNQTPASATFSLLQASSSNPTAGIKTDYKDFAPRVGFAATIRHGTVLRGAFSLSFMPNVGLPSLDNGTLDPPFAYNYGPVVGVGLNIQNVLYSGTGGFYGAPLPAPASSPAGVITSPISSLTGALTAQSFNSPSTYMEQFNLNLQQGWGQNVVTIAYVGELGRRLLVQPNVDLPDPPCGLTPYMGSLSGLVNGYAPSCPNPVAPAARYSAQLPNVNTIIRAFNAGTSSFNALEFTFLRHLSHGLNVNANYTWAHALDDVPNNSDSFAPWGYEPYNWQHYDYGNSDNDLRDRFAMSAVYTFPFTQSYAGLKGTLLKGWQMNGVAYWETGQSFSVEDFGQPPRIDIGSAIFYDRPQQIGNWKVSHPSISRAFNTAAFTAQPYGYPGNERRNQLFGPHQRRVDLSLFRDFPITESVKAQFRAEAYNVSNTPNFAFPSADLNTSTTFGVINTTTPADVRGRVFQFAGKITF